MSLDLFSRLYDDVRNLGTDLNYFKKINKDTVIEYLIQSLKANACADNLIKCQADTIMRSTNELVKQCEESRSVRTLNQNAPPLQPHAMNFSATLKAPPKIVMKKTPGTDALSLDDIGIKMKNALKTVQVNKTHVKDNSTLFIEVPDHKSYSAAIEKLGSEFSNYSLEESRKIAPKVTVMNVPLEMTETVFISEVCEKDPFLKGCIEHNKDEFLVLNSWNIKGRSGDPVAKKLAFKCSPRVRNHIIDKSGGYLYLNLLRCKVYDRFYAPQCYHCQRFNHFSRNCPDKDKIATCGKCADNHETKSCSKNIRKCANCIRYREPNVDHFSFSPDCPSLDKARKFLQSKTNYEEAKN